MRLSVDKFLCRAFEPIDILDKIYQDLGGTHLVRDRLAPSPPEAFPDADLAVEEFPREVIGQIPPSLVTDLRAAIVRIDLQQMADLISEIKSYNNFLGEQLEG